MNKLTKQIFGIGLGIGMLNGVAVASNCPFCNTVASSAEDIVLHSKSCSGLEALLRDEARSKQVKAFVNHLGKNEICSQVASGSVDGGVSIWMPDTVEECYACGERLVHKQDCWRNNANYYHYNY